MVLDGEAQPAGGMGICRQAKDEVYNCPPVLLVIGRADDGWLATWSRADAVVSHPIDPAALAQGAGGPDAPAGGRRARPPPGPDPAATVDARTSWPALIGALIKGETLTAEETAWAMSEIMDGAATPVQIAGFAVALRAKGETVGEVTGLARAMLEHATPDLGARAGSWTWSAPAATARTRSTSPPWARSPRPRPGARMVKHGNRAASSACGDRRRAGGARRRHRPAAGRDRAAGGRGRRRVPVRPALPPGLPARLGAAARAGRADGVQLPRPADQPGPARPRWPSGVADARMGPVLAGVLAERGNSALVFHGDDGLDELTTTGAVDRLGGARRHGAARSASTRPTLGIAPVPAGGPGGRRRRRTTPRWSAPTSAGAPGAGAGHRRC